MQVIRSSHPASARKGHLWGGALHTPANVVPITSSSTSPKSLHAQEGRVLSQLRELLSLCEGAGVSAFWAPKGVRVGSRYKKHPYFTGPKYPGAIVPSLSNPIKISYTFYFENFQNK